MLDADQRKLYDYLDAHRDGATFVAATDSWSTAAPYIIATGQDFLPMGGFSGSVPEPTMATARHLVDAGDVHYFLLSTTGAGGYAAGRRGGAPTPTAAIAGWVRSTCAEVPSTEWGVPEVGVGASVVGRRPSGGFGAGGGFGRGSGASTLYWC